MQDIDDDAIMSAEELLNEASRLAGFNMGNMFDEDGVPLAIQDLPEDAAVSLNEVEVEDGIVIKMKAGRDKKFGMDLLAKYHGLLEKHEQAGAPINVIYIDEKDAQA